MTGDLGNRQSDRDAAKHKPALKQGLLDAKKHCCAPGMSLTVRWGLSRNTGSKTEFSPLIQQNAWSLAVRYHKPNKSVGGGCHSRDGSYLPGWVGRKQGEKEKIQNCDPSLEEMLF